MKPWHSVWRGPGDEYLFPQYARRHGVWRCDVENRWVGYGLTRKRAWRAAMRAKAKAAP